MNPLRAVTLLALALLTASSPTFAQHKPMEATPAQQQASRRTRLVLRDGSYQLVMSYEVRGNIVRYRSAERDGVVEEIPLALVDLTATEQWARDHTPGAAPTEAPVVISPELAREEADRAARTPEVAKDLHLPEEDSMLALDTFRGTPELVPLAQAASDLNRETAHAVQRVDVNPASSAHRIGDIPGERADVQLHVQDPVFFVRVGKDDSDDTSGGTLTVDTHGQSGARTAAATGSEASRYVVERVDVRRGLRQVDSFRLAQLGGGRAQPDVIECTGQLLPGGHWLKLTPSQPLLFGEYALVEVLSDRFVNIDVWDFGVHSDAKENTEALHPEPPRPVQLERRRP